MARNCVRRTKVIKAVKNKKMSQKRGIKLKKKKKKEIKKVKKDLKKKKMS